MTYSLDLELAGVAVRVTCNDSPTFERLSVCYQDARLSKSIPASFLSASLHYAKEEWVIQVEGRDTIRQTEFIAAVRAFNHELVHGVMLSAPDSFFVHAGVVALRSGCLALPGLTQAGKSTLVLALALAGARVLSDELLVYDVREDQVLAFSRAIKIRDLCLPYFADMEEEFVGTGEGRFLPASRIFAERDKTLDCQGQDRLCAVIVPQWSVAGDNVLVPISKGEAFLELTASALNFGTHREQSLKHLSELIKSAVSYRLQWSDPHVAAANIMKAGVL